MHKLRRLLVPTGQEMTLYSFVALVLLLIVNSSAIWKQVFTTVQADVTARESAAQNLKSLIADATTLSDPQVVNAVAWGVTALIGFSLAVALSSFVGGMLQDRQDVGKTAATKRLYVTRMLIRIASVLGLLWFGLLFAVLLLPHLSGWFLQGLLHPITSWNTVPIALLSVFGVAAALYAIAVLFRMAALKVRVFSDQIE